MFEQLFTSPAVLRRHREAPWATERGRYLAYRAAQGCARPTLLRLAQELRVWPATSTSPPVWLCPRSRLPLPPSGGPRDSGVVGMRGAATGPDDSSSKSLRSGSAFSAACPSR